MRVFVISLVVATIVMVVAMYMNNRRNIAVASVMRKPVDLPLWLEHHRKMGVTHFYIRLEDTPGLVPYLKEQEDVVLEVGESNKSNNYTTIMDRQQRFVTFAIEHCAGKAKFLFHIDSDELLHGSFDFLWRLPRHVKCLHMQNVEAIYEEGNDSCFATKKFIRCDTGECKAFANGKAGGRVERGVHPAGCHYFAYNGDIDKHTYQVPFETLHVLHFDSCSVGSWAEKFSHMAKGNSSDIPFKYYHDSIESAGKAYQVYKEHKMMNENIDQKDLYIREDFRG